MAAHSLREVGEKLSFECVLCGKEIGVERMDLHARAHARRGECWSYTSFAGASQLDATLEAWPVASADGGELLWPFWERTERLAGLPRPLAIAG